MILSPGGTTYHFFSLFLQLKRIIMPNTYSQLYYHFVFSPQNRESMIKKEFEKDLYKYIAGIINNLNQNLIQINGMPDHIHLLVRLKPNITPSEFIQKVKSNSSRWINNNRFLPRKFSWQTGGGIFTIDYYRIDLVKEYIINQKEHHKITSFKKEYIDFLTQYNIEYKTEYLLEFF